MDKKDTVHRDNGMLLSHKNEIGSFVIMWMNVQSVIQSKVSQKEKKKYILMHIYGI